MFRNLWRDESGLTLTEWVLLAALVVVAASCWIGTPPGGGR